MLPLRFDRPLIEALLARAADELDGEWLLVGGAAAATWFGAERATEDIDLIGLGHSNAERVAVMDLAQRAGLPVEAVNSTADYFVRRLAGWREQLVVWRRGRATIYRPTATLFVRLKLARLSAIDLADCQALRASAAAAELDRAALLAELAALPPSRDEALTQRRLALAALLSA